MDNLPHILVVEDEAVLRRSIAEYYEDRGVAVTQAGSVAAAQTKLRATTFDAVLLDVSLPDGNGLSLLEYVPANRALVITSMPDPPLYRNLGVEFVPKPFDFAALNQVLSTMFGELIEHSTALNSPDGAV